MAAGSVAGGSVAGDSPEGAVAAPPQAETINPRIKTTMILRIIQTHFRIHAGQQVNSGIRDRISPVVISAIRTSILPFMTSLKANKFPFGDQDGVSTCPSVK